MALTSFSDGGNGDFYDAITLNSTPIAAVEPAEKLASLWGEIKK